VSSVSRRCYEGRKERSSGCRHRYEILRFEIRKSPLQDLEKVSQQGGKTRVIEVALDPVERPMKGAEEIARNEKREGIAVVDDGFERLC